MPQKKYKVEHLPVADRDLAEIFAYIALDLAAPQTAANLLVKIDRTISKKETATQVSGRLLTFFRNVIISAVLRA